MVRNNLISGPYSRNRYEAVWSETYSDTWHSGPCRTPAGPMSGFDRWLIASARSPSAERPPLWRTPRAPGCNAHTSGNGHSHIFRFQGTYILNMPLDVSNKSKIQFNEDHQKSVSTQEAFRRSLKRRSPASYNCSELEVQNKLKMKNRCDALVTWSSWLLLCVQWKHGMKTAVQHFLCKYNMRYTLLKFCPMLVMH